MGKHRFQIERNAEGNKLAYLSPVNENNLIGVGYRIAGPKAWGGSTNIAQIDIDSEDLARYIREYAPDVLKQLNI